MVTLKKQSPKDVPGSGQMRPVTCGYSKMTDHNDVASGNNVLSFSVLACVSECVSFADIHQITATFQYTDNVSATTIYSGSTITLVALHSGSGIRVDFQFFPSAWEHNFFASVDLEQ